MVLIVLPETGSLPTGSNQIIKQPLSIDILFSIGSLALFLFIKEEGVVGIGLKLISLKERKEDRMQIHKLKQV